MAEHESLLPEGDGFDEPPAWDWCPDCECWFPMDTGCPTCFWPEDAWATGPEPEPEVPGWWADLLTEANYPEPGGPWGDWR